ncbi:Invasion protein B family [Pseudomonas chlororaphis subsp. aurantiaca]|uniref:InvB/SpaK family type III secretion system chaperone n=1 Tax=Pseudomonas chlororaphis TaxID=587753 RepID=UPI0027DAE1E8|nr:Invasion protein B family [Pseudomonas chlororaphis]WMI97562.1 Invasion protein B family [Pseudomonas chlororaphis subsp. aurantiaca]
MHTLDIASLLRDALVLSGCTSEQVGSFDGHSTIELELTNLPAINIGVVDDGLWFWSNLIESTPMLLAHRSEDLLRFLMQGCAFALTEQLQLVETNGMLEVRVRLAESAYASAEALAQTVEAYLAALTALYDLVHR